MEREMRMQTHTMSAEMIADFISHEREQAASANMLRRFSCAVQALYAYLPEDKTVTKERLLAWRKSMEESGYAAATVQNYAKHINRYLVFAGCSSLRVF